MLVGVLWRAQTLSAFSDFLERVHLVLRSQSSERERARPLKVCQSPGGAGPEDVIGSCEGGRGPGAETGSRLGAARGPAQLLARSFLFPPRRPGEVVSHSRARPDDTPRAHPPAGPASRAAPLGRRAPRASPTATLCGATSGRTAAPRGSAGRGAEARRARSGRSMRSGGGCHGPGAARGPVAAAHRPVDTHRQHDSAARSEVG